MKLLFIETTHSIVGGVGSRHARLAEALPAFGWNAVFALTRGARFHDPDAYLKNLPPIDFVELDARTGTSEGRRFAIEDAIRRVQPDVVIPGAVLDAWIVAEQLKGPRTVYELPGININTISFVARHAAAIDACFGVSPLTVRVLRDYCGIAAERTFLVPTGVRKASRFPVRSGSLRLIYVGRFDGDKRALDAIELSHELRRRNLDVQLTMIGSGRYLDELKNAGISVHPPTTPAALYDEIYPNADAILLFSPVEGLPNAILEGMAHGLVPIVSDFDGRKELGLLRDGETALVFPVGDMKAAADRVAQVMASPELAVNIGTNARQLIEAERSVERMTAEFVKVLQKAIEGPPRSVAAPAVQYEGRSRLRRLVGPRLAERIRRMAGRSFAHVDASEWPLIDNVEPPDREREEVRLRAVIGDEH